MTNPPNNTGIDTGRDDLQRKILHLLTVHQFDKPSLYEKAGVLADELYPDITKAVKDAQYSAYKEGYQDGKVAEAKICEKAKRHDCAKAVADAEKSAMLRQRHYDQKLTDKAVADATTLNIDSYYTFEGEEYFKVSDVRKALKRKERND